jgi:hypothetical protein
MAKSEAFVCRQCGAVHEGLPTDWGFNQPDEVFALKYIDEYLRVRSNKDFCTLDETRYFIRGVLLLPFQEQKDDFGWGIWAEVSRTEHDLYLRYFNDDGSALPRFDGRIANSMPGYPETIGVPVQVQLGAADARPRLWLSQDANHLLRSEQEQGIGAARHHELLQACGYFNKKSA